MKHLLQPQGLELLARIAIRNRRTPKKASVLFMLACLSAHGPLCAQEPLTNDAILKLVKGGISQEVIVGMVAAQPVRFETGVEEILALKQAGVSDKVIAAMVARTQPAAGSGIAPRSGQAETGLPEDVGVYVTGTPTPRMLPTEVVNMKTAGMWKTMAFAKGSWLGTITGVRSAARVSLPIKLMLRCADGVDPVEYQLLRLEPKKDRRDFVFGRAGGFGSASMGVSQNAIALKYERVARNIYETRIENIKPGEYGFLVPGSSAGSGKIYTFSIE